MVAIQIRDVPEAVRDALAGEADARGQSLQMFLSEVLEREARLVRNRAWLDRIRDAPIARVEGDSDTAELIDRQRKERIERVIESRDPAR